MKSLLLSLLSIFATLFKRMRAKDRERTELITAGRNEVRAREARETLAQIQKGQQGAARAAEAERQGASPEDMARQNDGAWR